jgi:uncharacterized lipoprotein YmbA
MPARFTTPTIAVVAALWLGGCASMPNTQANCRQPNYPLALAGTVVGGLLGG